MMSRPTAFLALALAALAVATAPPARAAEESALSDARTPIEGFYATLLECMQQAEALGLEGRTERLGPVVDGTYDVGFMAEKVLGRHWKTLSEEQRTAWLGTFRALTVSTYANRFASYAGEQLLVDQVEPASRGTAVVHTRIVPAGEAAVDIRYRMRPDADGAWRIIDVYLNGTVSELALRRSEYSAVIKREGFDHLLSSLREKIARGDTI